MTVLWWGAYGGLAYELQSLAKRIISLCCSASGCERNWSDFAAVSTVFLFVHTSYFRVENFRLSNKLCPCADPYKKEKQTGAQEAK
jgi:hypothetical protein